MPVASNNLLLTGVGVRVRHALLHGTEPVMLRAGERLWEAGARASCAIFPIECSISLMVDFDDEPTVEAGLVGREGMIGVPLVLGTPIRAFSAIVQGSGRAWSVEYSRLAEALEGHGTLRQQLNRYVCARLQQLAQGAGCRGFHRVEARLARWLLMSRDRARSDDLILTHEILGHMLGVRRAGVTIAARALQDRQLIGYSRGRIHVLDGRGLEAAACSCYAVEKKIYAALLG
jgi:CRP-like cAMP-binding protein